MLYFKLILLDLKSFFSSEFTFGLLYLILSYLVGSFIVDNFLPALGVSGYEIFQITVGFCTLVLIFIVYILTIEYKETLDRRIGELNDTNTNF